MGAVVVVVVVRVGGVFSEPEPGAGIDQEPGRAVFVSGARAVVDAPDLRRVAVGETQRPRGRPAAGVGGSQGACCLGADSGPVAELDSRDDVVALSLALLLVGGDAVAAHGGDVAHEEHVARRRRQPSRARLAHVWATAVGDGVHVAAVLASLDRVLDDRGAGAAGGVQVAHSELDPVHEVLAALVVDEAVRPELRHSQESGALQQIAPGAAPCHVRGQRQTWERVSRQEAL